MSATWHYGRLRGPHCHCRAYRASYGLPCQGHELEDSDSDDCRTGIVDIIRMATDVMCIIREDYCIPHVEHGGGRGRYISCQPIISSVSTSLQPPIFLSSQLVQSPISLDLPSMQPPTSLDPPLGQPLISLDLPLVQAPTSWTHHRHNLLLLQTHHQHNPLPL
ncbi:hypothetical protein AAG906_019018 [Vitis piasezkii]